MDKKLREFDVMPSAEMQKLGSMYAENWKPLHFEATDVPEDLNDLIPWAARFGVTCDITRHDLGEKTPQAEKDRLSDALRGRHARINEWLNEGRRDALTPCEVPNAQAAFIAMCVFELEENGGPGLAGGPASFQEVKRSRKRRETREQFKQRSSGPPCPRCGERLRTPAARQCAACGTRL